MRGLLTSRGRPRALRSLRAYLVGLVLVCVVPVMAFSVWLTVVLTAPMATLGRPWMRSLGAIGAAVLLLGVGLAPLAGRAIIRSLARLVEAAAELGRDLDAAEHARALAERAVRAREAQLAAIVSQATAGIAQTDLEGRLLLMNRRYCDLVDVSRARWRMSHLPTRSLPTTGSARSRPCAA